MQKKKIKNLLHMFIFIYINKRQHYVGRVGRLYN